MLAAHPSGTWRAAVGLTCALLAAAPAFAQEGPLTAPMGLRTQGSVRELFLELTIADARPAPALLLDVRYAVANDWGIPTIYRRGDQVSLQLLDEQADSITASFRVPWAKLLGSGPRAPGSARPLWERIGTTFESRLTLHWGGWSDVPIEAWHDLTGAFNFNRADYPRNQVSLYLGDLNGLAAFDVRSSRLALGDLVARTQVTLAEGGVGFGALEPGGYLPSRWGVSLRVDAKAPVGLLSRLGGSGGWDVGAAIVGSADPTFWLTAHALFGMSYFSSFSVPIALQPKPWHLTGEVSLVATLFDFAFILEDRVVSPLLSPGWPREEAGGNNGLLASSAYGSFRSHNQVSWGLRRGRFTLWLSEDFTPGDNSRSTLHWLYNSNAPDVVIGLAFTQPL